MCSASRALAGGWDEYHAIHITKMGRVDDILRRDAELGAGCRRAYKDDVAITALSELVDAIARFEIGRPSLEARVAVKEFVRKSRGRCARRLL